MKSLLVRLGIMMCFVTFGCDQAPAWTVGGGDTGAGEQSTGDTDTPPTDKDTELSGIVHRNAETAFNSTSGGGEVSSTKYRAQLVIGGNVLKKVSNDKYTVKLGVGASQFSQ